MLTGSYHCGTLCWSFTGQPDSATACNWTIGRRYGALWIYGWAGETITTTGLSTAYSHGAVIEFHFCSTCGCLAHYQGRQRDEQGRQQMAVSLRMIDDPATVAALPIDHFDGLDTFDTLPRDHRCVADMWFS
ncbi:MAG: GFA family protein [Leptolyngbyaceae cyanobacterium]